MLGIVGLLAGIASLLCFIFVLVKQFQTAGPVHGIIGIVTCGLWTFIWGWMNAGKAGIRNIMLIWTVLWIAAFALNIASGTIYFTGSMG